MTALIQSQLFTMGIMLYCGMTVGIIYDVFSLFIRKFFEKNKVIIILIRLLNYVVIGMVIGEFLMFCQNGKINLIGMFFLAIGLWLWRKIFYGTINPR